MNDHGLMVSDYDAHHMHIELFVIIHIQMHMKAKILLRNVIKWYALVHGLPLSISVTNRQIMKFNLKDPNSLTFQQEHIP